jgi:hypothetical protein
MLMLDLAACHAQDQAREARHRAQEAQVPQRRRGKLRSARPAR